MSRKKISIIALILAFALIVALTGCSKENERTVLSISIIDGSFKDTYYLDETPDYSKAKIYVTYTSGKTEVVAITRDMVTGLDTGRTTLNGLLTVTFNGVSTKRVYRVIASEGVKTPFRLKAEIVNEKGSARIIKIRATKCSDVDNGVYALKFTVTVTGGATLNPEADFKAGGDWEMSVNVNSSTSVTVVAYSASGGERLEDDVEIIEFRATTVGTEGYLSVQSVYISDGTEDFVVPEVGMQLG